MTLLVERARAEEVAIEAIALAKARQLQRASGLASPLWDPLPGPQTRAFESEADIIGYGGSAGGGKSAMMIGLAMTRHRRALILRRELNQVRHLWEYALQVAGPYGRPNENLHLLRDLPGDRSVEFGGLKDPGDWKKFQGHPFDLHAFDEATEFTEAQFRTLIAWNRTTIPGQRCRVVAAFNPPTTAEGQWIIGFFGPWLDPQHPHPAEPGELRWYATTITGEEIECEDGTPFEHEGETLYPKSRTFFPARVTDNPFLLETGYVATLQALPEPLRSQMLYGDFGIGLKDDVWQVIPTDWIRQAQERFRELERGHFRTVFVCVGADIGAGGDKTVFGTRVEVPSEEIQPEPPAREALARLERFDHRDTMRTKNLLALTLRELGGYAVIDVVGIGAGVYDGLREDGYPAVAFNAGAGTERRDRSGKLGFANVRSGAWWHLRERLDPQSDVPIALLPDRQLEADLTAPHWRPTSGGRIQVESKEEIRKRLGRSTDDGDATIEAFWSDGSPQGATAGQASSRWNPTPFGSALRVDASDDEDEATVSRAVLVGRGSGRFTRGR